MHLARLASAVKKAKEQDDEEADLEESSLGGTRSTVGSRAARARAHAERAFRRRRGGRRRKRARDPPAPGRDFSEYTVGAGWRTTWNLTRRPPGLRRTALRSGVFGDVAGFGLTSSPTPMGAVGDAARGAEVIAAAEDADDAPDTPPRGRLFNWYVTKKE